MLTTLLAVLFTAHAQETLDLGVLTEDDVTVVQKTLYPKAGRSEIGVHAGVMPFDPFLVTPNLQVSYDSHSSDRFSFGVLVGGGYGLQNVTSRTLSSPTYGVIPFAYRYLASGLVGVQLSPIYAKMNLNGAKVLHFDVYIPIRAGVTLEQSIVPNGGLSVGPTVSAGLGTRIFVGPNTALRVALRDDVILQRRALTSSWAVKQNAGVTVGITMLSKVKEVR